MEQFSLQRDPQGLNVRVLDGKGLSFDTLAQEGCASPFLADKRMVVVEGLVESGDDATLASFSTLLDTIPESTVLIVWEEQETYKKKVQKTLLARLAAEKYSQRFDLLSGSALQGFIGAEIIERGGAIQKAAVFVLAKLFDGDMWGLHQIMDQLIAYASAREITAQDVSLFCVDQADDDIFALVDAIVNKDKKQMVALLEQQYRIGKDALYVFAMVLRQFRIHMQLRDCLDANVVIDAKEMGMHPYVVKKTLPSVRQYSSERLRSIYTELLDTDVRIKTGILPANIAVERLLADCVV